MSVLWGSQWGFGWPSPAATRKVLHKWRTTGLGEQEEQAALGHLCKPLILLTILKITVQIQGNFFILEFAKSPKLQSSSQSYPQIWPAFRRRSKAF
jgi:hypothetical protein